MKDKLKTIQEFYEKLYSAKGGSEEKNKKYIEKKLETKLSEEDKDILEQKFMKQEIEEVIKNLKIGKTPGMDGLGPEFYKIFKKNLIPRLEKLFNNILDGGEILPSWHISTIVLIPKPGKYKSEIASYRPISLINHDAKLFTAILAKRLNGLIGKYIKNDQCGFIKGR